MFYIEDDSEDAEEKVNEGPFSRTEDVYHGKAPPGILVSAIHQYLLLSLQFQVEVRVGMAKTDTRQKM